MRCYSNSIDRIIDCPQDANDVCTSAMCYSLEPNKPGVYLSQNYYWGRFYVLIYSFLVADCIAGFDKASACETLNKKYCNTTEKKYETGSMDMSGCVICSKDECNYQGIEDEPDWRKTTPNADPIQTDESNNAIHLLNNRLWTWMFISIVFGWPFLARCCWIFFETAIMMIEKKIES